MLPPSVWIFLTASGVSSETGMSVVLDQALVATADSIDLLDAISAVCLHCEAAYDVVNTRAQTSTGYDRTGSFGRVKENTSARTR
jgi:hypothetical protein